jgi:aminopeptidase N
MYRTLLGWPTFRKAMDLYFKRHDGQAVTCDDFRRAMADASGRDLTQFERWYLQVRLHLGWRDCISGWRLGWPP